MTRFLLTLKPFQISCLLNRSRKRQTNIKNTNKLFMINNDNEVYYDELSKVIMVTRFKWRQTYFALTNYHTDTGILLFVWSRIFSDSRLNYFSISAAVVSNFNKNS